MRLLNRTTRPAFTLIEMLVVISIMVIVLGVSFPMIAAMRRDTSTNAGVNTVTIAVPMTRHYATSDITRGFSNDLVRDVPSDPFSIGIQSAKYSGFAALFTPAGEIRITVNDAGAESESQIFSSPHKLERRGPTVFDIQGAGLPELELNGFADYGQIDYLTLPSDTGVAGINRVRGNGPQTANANDPPWLLPPPFAVWFSQSGQLIATGVDPSGNPNPYEFVYYDGDYDHDYNVWSGGSRTFRPSVYDPDEYNPNSGKFDTRHVSPDGQYILPFEAIEAVVGVYVYSQDAFQEANDRWKDGETDPAVAAPPWTDASASDNNARWQWMQKNGQLLMFSRQSGAIMRNRNE